MQLGTCTQVVSFTVSLNIILIVSLNVSLIVNIIGF